MCAPLRMLIPMASTSSWIAASTMASGDLPQSGVDHFHTGITQCSGNHPRTTVVTIQPRFRHEYTYRSSHTSLLP